MLGVLFAADNRDTVSISVFPLPYTAEMPKFLFAIMCFALGVVIGGLTISAKLGQARRLVKAERRQVTALQNEMKARQAEQLDKLPTAASK